ncbi:MAG: (2Fe-2S)-binding protein, partial [Verrucomicrobiota bacterium]|nr:(2Fe-2S)-binding protein [Verrucomicrobiota bacterium]
IALESSLALTSPDGHKRELPLREFYPGYKKLNKEPDEVVTEISFPVFSENTYVNWEKVSKRAWLDIATVNAACKFEVVDNHFARASLALGGVSATPLYLNEASVFLKNKPVLMDTVLDCLTVAQSEFKPIGDVRGSAQYKRLLARQLLLANFVKLFPESIDQEALYAAL